MNRLNKKVYQSKGNRPLGNRCLSNKWKVCTDLQWSHWIPMNRQTDRYYWKDYLPSSDKNVITSLPQNIKESLKITLLSSFCWNFDSFQVNSQKHGNTNRSDWENSACNVCACGYLCRRYICRVCVGRLNALQPVLFIPFLFCSLFNWVKILSNLSTFHHYLWRDLLKVKDKHR